MINKYVLVADEAEHLHSLKTWAVGTSFNVGDLCYHNGATFLVTEPFVGAASNEPIITDLIIDTATYGVSTSIATPGVDTSIPTEQAVRELDTASAATTAANLAACRAAQYAQQTEIQIYRPADAAAATDRNDIVFACPASATFTVLEAGIITEAAVGGATNYPILTLKNIGTNATGTVTIATRNFNAATTARVKESLGAIGNPTVTDGEILELQRTHGGSGLVVSVGVFYLILERQDV